MDRLTFLQCVSKLFDGHGRRAANSARSRSWNTRKLRSQSRKFGRFVSTPDECGCALDWMRREMIHNFIVYLEHGPPDLQSDAVSDKEREQIALQKEIVARLLVLRVCLGPRLGLAFDALADRLALFDSKEPGYFLHPLALPILQLPVWTAEVARSRGAELSVDSVLDCVEAAALGYLHVRVQDDLMDEGVGEAASAMLLAEALFVRHQVLLARIVPPGSSFWPRFQARWLAYGEAMLLEQHLHESDGVTDAVAFEQVLQRSWPLSLPAAAVLSMSALLDGAELDDALHALVTHLTRAHQLFTDLLDAEKDLRNKNYTYVVCRFTTSNGEGGERNAKELRRRLMLGRGIDEVVAEVHRDLDRAAEAARVLGAEGACRFIETRRAFMADVQRRAFAGFFEQLLGLPRSDETATSKGG